MMTINCPHCAAQCEVAVKDKTAVKCVACKTLFEVTPNGQAMISPLPVKAILTPHVGVSGEDDDAR